jgi:hypothetical protein
MGEMVRCAGEVNYFRYYKRLGPIAKLATSYCKDSESLLCLLVFMDPTFDVLQTAIN